MNRSDFLLAILLGTPIPAITGSVPRTPTTGAYLWHYFERLRTLRPRIGMVTFYSTDFPTDLSIESTIRPNDLERAYRTTTADQTAITSLVDTILTSKYYLLPKGFVSDDQRWGVVFEDAHRRRLWSLYLCEGGIYGMTQDYRTLGFGDDLRIYAWLMTYFLEHRGEYHYEDNSTPPPRNSLQL